MTCLVETACLLRIRDDGDVGEIGIGGGCEGDRQSFCRLYFVGVRGGDRGDLAGVIEGDQSCASSAGVMPRQCSGPGGHSRAPSEL